MYILPIDPNDLRMKMVRFHPSNLKTHINAGNKAIRDGKYLAPAHANAWQRSPH